MAFKYEINGSVIEFDREPTEADIDEVAASLSSQKMQEKPIEKTPAKIDSPAFGLLRGLSNAVPGTLFATQYYAHGGPFRHAQAMQEAEKISNPIEQAKLGSLAGKAEIAGEVAPSLALASPFFKVAGMIPTLGKSTIARGTLGLGGFSGIKKLIEGKPEEVVSAGLSGAGQGALFGGMGKIGSSIMPKVVPFAERIGSAGGGFLAGALTGEDDGRLKNAFMMAGMGALFPSSRFAGKGRYTKNKVLAIREGAKRYHQEEVNAYGEGIKKLPNQKIDGADFLTKTEELLKERGVVSPDGQVNKFLSAENSKLYKAYERLYSKFGNSPDGSLDLEDIVKEYQDIKGTSGLKPTANSRIKTEAANNFFSSVRDQIDSDAWKKLNARYAIFKQNEKAIDKYFDIWGSEQLTGRGERTLLNIFEPERSDVGKIVTKTTGQTLKGAKLRSAGVGIIKNPLTRWGLFGGGAYTLGRMFHGK